MNRVFEYEGLRALLNNSAIRDELADYVRNPNMYFHEVCDFLMHFGLECYQTRNEALVVFVHKTPRKRPACAVVSMSPENNASSLFNAGSHVISMFKAGEFDVEGSS